MDPRYSSFLLRCWRLADGRRRVEIEHIQTGVRARVGSLAAASAWIETRQVTAVTPEAPAADEPPAAAREEKTP